MLYSNLKLAGYKYIDPVYVGFCGVRKLIFAILNDFILLFGTVSSIMSLMKMIIDKKIFVTAETDDNRVKS